MVTTPPAPRLIGISSMANGPLARPTAALTQFLDSEAKEVLQ